MLNSARELKFPRYPLFAGENMIRSPRPREGVLIHPQTTARTTDHECFDAAPPSLPQGANRRQVAVTSVIGEGEFVPDLGSCRQIEHA